MSKKMTVAQLGPELVAVNGGPKKATKVGTKPIVTLMKKQAKLAWWRPGAHWWSLPVWRVFHRTAHGITVRRLCVLDVLQQPARTP